MIQLDINRHYHHMLLPALWTSTGFERWPETRPFGNCTVHQDTWLYLFGADYTSGDWSVEQLWYTLTYTQISDDQIPQRQTEHLSKWWNKLSTFRLSAICYESNEGRITLCQRQSVLRDMDQDEPISSQKKLSPQIVCISCSQNDTWCLVL